MLMSHAHGKIKSMATAAILIVAAGCSKSEPPEAEPVAPVQTVAAQRLPIRHIIQSRGILYPYDQAGIVPKISAPIRAFYVNRGDHVRQGQLLAVLENRDLEAAAAEGKRLVEQAESAYRSTTVVSLPEEIAKAQSEVQISKEELDAAQKVYDSRKALLEQGALARKQLDEATVAYIQARNRHNMALQHLEALQKVGREEQTKTAQAQLDAAKARNEGASAQLGYSQIYCPISGVIADRPLYAGEMAAAGAPLLTVMNISSVIARANVPADQLSYIKLGNAATIAASDASAELHGKVTVVSPALEQNSTTAEIWISAPNPGERLRPGSSVQVSILAETVPDAVVIPLSALLPSQEGATIVMVAGSDALAHERKIETGIREGDKIQVVKGLEPGEQVITVGALGLQDKAKISFGASGKHE
jgi:HlyD family secretion protein